MIDSVQNKEKLGFLCIDGNLDYHKRFEYIRFKPKVSPLVQT